MAVYPPKGLIFVGIRGVPPTELETDEGFVGVWSIRDSGDVPSRWTIGGPWQPASSPSTSSTMRRRGQYSVKIR